MVRLLIALMLVTVAGCAAKEQPPKSLAVPTENRLSYFSDRYGNCFASLEDRWGMSISIATIPCERMP
jgi:hypothetical protein